MAKNYTVDTSVFVASFVESEPLHSKAKKILHDIFNSDSYFILPYTVLVELISAVRRRTGSPEIALRVKKMIESNDHIKFVPLNELRIKQTLALSIDLGLRGMDTILVQVSKEFDTELITFDEEIIKKIPLH